MKATKQFLIIIFVAALLFVVGNCHVQAATNFQPYMIQDQLHLLTPAQKQKIILQNQRWEHKRNRPQLWVYTLKKRPADIEDLGDDLLRSIAKKVTSKNDDYDWETEIDTKTQELHRNISLLVAYPGKGTQVKVIKSDDLAAAASDFQDWQLHRGLSNRIAGEGVIYQYFSRFAPFVNKHVAGVKTINPGISWGTIITIIMIPIAILIIVLIIRWFYKLPPSGGDDDSSFDDGYVIGRWMR